MNNFPRKKFLIFLAGIATVALIFGSGFFIAKTQIKCRVCPPEKVDFSLFWETWDKLRKSYVDPSQMDTQKMIYGAISGMVNSLKDPYTVFLDPENSKKFLEDASGRFEGVGMEVGIRKGTLQVISPIKGTPADQAGLRAGDKILEIDDKTTIEMSIDEAVSYIRGPKGTTVTLTIFRDEWEKTNDFTITRDLIEVPSVEWELKDIGDNKKTAYIKLYQFSEVAGLDFSQVVQEILASPSQTIILDLRNNPGGYLEVAQDISGWFLERGKIVAIEDEGRGKEKIEYKAKGNSRLVNYPLVILINEGSASGAEILAGALRDNREVKLIGEKSYGKGSVQHLENLSDGSSLKVTVAKWLTPKGASIHEVGLEPDIKVELTQKDFEEKKDPQLDKAIEIVKELR